VQKGISQKVRELLLSFGREQFVVSECFASLEEAFDSGPGILDLFAGSRGFSRGCVRAAQTWTLTFDISHSSSEDLLDPSLQERIWTLLRLGAFAGWTSVRQL